MSRSRVRRVVVAGGGLAGLTAARTLREAGYDGELSVLSDEPHGPYDRPPLSKRALTAGTSPWPLVALPEADARWLPGVAARRLDPVRRTIDLDDGRTLRYDGAVLATGSRARRLPGQPPGVHVLRTLDDACGLRTALAAGARRVVILGAGLVGAETAATLRVAGHQVTLVDRGATPLAASIGAAAATLVLGRHRGAGVHVMLCASPAGFSTGRAGSVTGVRLRGPDLGEVSVPADVVVVALGVDPATGWLRGAPVARSVSGHLLVDAYARVLGQDRAPLPGLTAAGDVTAFPSAEPGGGRRSLGHWAHAREQARVAALTLLHGPAAAYAALPSHWTDQYDLRVRVLGRPDRTAVERVLERDPTAGRLVAVYERDGAPIAAVAVNRPSRLGALRDMVTSSPPPAKL